MARRLRRAGPGRGPRARDFPAAQAARPRARATRAAAAGAQHALQELDRARRPGAVSRQPRARAAHLFDRALERACHGGARQPRACRARRPHRQLRVGGRSVRSRLQPFLPRRARRRPGVLPAALRPGGLCARLSRRPAHRGESFPLPQRDRRQGPVLVLPSLPDAGVLAVSDRLDGPRAAQRDLPGALHAVSRAPRHPEDRGPQAVGLRRRRRNGRARVARRAVARGARRLGQPDLCRQLQPAAPGWPGARQRLDRAGARRPVRRRRLERDQAAMGLGLGPVVRAR